MIKKNDDEVIEKENTFISDEEFRDAVVNHEFPDFMYGLVFPEFYKTYDLTK